MNKRLFGVKQNGKRVGDWYENKQEAKEARNALGAGARVCIGPDHMGPHGHKSKYRDNKPR